MQFSARRRVAFYGLAVGDSVAEGEASPSSAAFFLFFFGVAVGEADSFAAAVVPFFIVDFLVVAAVEVPVEVVAAVSCFCAQETTNAVAITATIKDSNDFFIGVWLRFVSHTRFVSCCRQCKHILLPSCRCRRRAR
jgi:hypothetical protein